jgi:hypothetical protein
MLPFAQPNNERRQSFKMIQEVSVNDSSGEEVQAASSSPESRARRASPETFRISDKQVQFFENMKNSSPFEGGGEGQEESAMASYYGSRKTGGLKKLETIKQEEKDKSK